MITKKQLQALQRKKAEAIQKRQEILDGVIAESRGYTDEERSKVKDLQTEINDLDEQIREGQELIEQRDGLSGSDDKPSGADGDEPADKRAVYANPGEFVRDLYLATKRGVVSEKLQSHRSWQEEEFRKLNIQDGSSYGDLIPDNFESGALKFIGAGGYVRSKCRVISAGNKAGRFKKRVLKQGQAGVYNGILVNFHGQGNAPTDPSKLDFDQFMLDASDNKISLFYITDRETLDNTVGVSGDMQDSFLGAKAELEDELAIIGDGVGKPLGILNSNTKGTYNVARNTTGQVKVEDIFKMAKHMYPRAKDVNWEISLDLYEQIAALKDDAGRFIMIKGDATKGVPDVLHGRPIHWNEFSPSAGERGDIMLVSWGFYFLYDGATYYFDIDKSQRFMEDEVVVKLTFRLDGATWVKEALKLKNKMDVSPFVVLEE